MRAPGCVPCWWVRSRRSRTEAPPRLPLAYAFQVGSSRSGASRWAGNRASAPGHGVRRGGPGAGPVASGARSGCPATPRWGGRLAAIARGPARSMRKYTPSASLSRRCRWAVWGRVAWWAASRRSQWPVRWRPVTAMAAAQSLNSALRCARAAGAGRPRPGRRGAPPRAACAGRGRLPGWGPATSARRGGAGRARHSVSHSPSQSRRCPMTMISPVVPWRMRRRSPSGWR